MEFKLFWSEEAVRGLENVLDYLTEKWFPKEVENFKQMLTKQLNLLTRFPYMFPASIQHPELRKAVLSRQTNIHLL